MLLCVFGCQSHTAEREISRKTHLLEYIYPLNYSARGETVTWKAQTVDHTCEWLRAKLIWQRSRKNKLRCAKHRLVNTLYFLVIVKKCLLVLHGLIIYILSAHDIRAAVASYLNIRARVFLLRAWLNYFFKT
jgi:hypothetical protein